MDSRYSQSDFISKWNQIAKLLRSCPVEELQNLPLLQKDGVCAGLILKLEDFSRKYQDEVFYNLYHYICAADPVQVANIILQNYKTNEQVMALLCLIKDTNSLQQNQDQIPDLPAEMLPQDLRSLKKTPQTFSEYQSTLISLVQLGISNQATGTTHGSLESFKDYEICLNGLQNGERGLIVWTKHDGSHIMRVKRNKNSFEIFDPNDGNKCTFSSADEAGKYLFLQTMKAETNVPWFMDTKLEVSSDTLKGAILCIGMLTFPITIPTLYLTRCLTFKRSPTEELELANKIISTQENKIDYFFTKLTVPKAQPVAREKQQKDTNELSYDKFVKSLNEYNQYKDNFFFGIRKLRSSNETKLIQESLFIAKDDKTRTKIANEYIEKNKDKKFAKILERNIRMTK